MENPGYWPALKIDEGHAVMDQYPLSPEDSPKISVDFKWK
jgi:hypothetical protein